MRAATAADVDDLAALAAATFPLACPPSLTDDDIAAFVAANFTPARFADHLADPGRAVLVAIDADADADRIVGYTMLVCGVADTDDVRRAVTFRPAIEISKMYVAPGHHGRGVAAALMAAALDSCRARGAAGVWLGVNGRNLRAQRFYSKHGFVRTGDRTFRVGKQLEHDHVMVRLL
ncbi:GNAT family N-acetyltransferase [Mycobacterium sp. MYCO198283]|nr:GNAT family N-acetyltransferase [Mycobacterium sp. MYCO198283]MCG5433923.1 GNAT family N-acetyltransferase [Mycobacterium sp. MYCO198283]